MSVTTSSNPFASAEAWETSVDQLLPVGAHVVKILSAEGSTTESSGNPTIILKLGNDQGTIMSWESYHSEFLRKVVALYDSCGLARPVEGEFNPEDRCRLTDVKIAQLQDQTVGIVVVDEEDNMNPGRTRRRVKGYVAASKVDGGADSRGLESATTSSAVADADIPFHHEDSQLDHEAWHCHANR